METLWWKSICIRSYMVSYSCYMAMQSNHQTQWLPRDSSPHHYRSITMLNRLKITEIVGWTKSFGSSRYKPIHIWEKGWKETSAPISFHCSGLRVLCSFTQGFPSSCFGLWYKQFLNEVHNIQQTMLQRLIFEAVVLWCLAMSIHPWWLTLTWTHCRSLPVQFVCVWHMVVMIFKTANISSWNNFEGFVTNAAAIQ